MSDAERWQFFASAQLALMLGSKLDPNDPSMTLEAWKLECDRLADAIMKESPSWNK